MSTIEVAVVHKFEKSRQQKTSKLTERDSLNEITGPVAQLAEQLHQLYAGRGGKGFGRFEPNETT